MNKLCLSLRRSLIVAILLGSLLPAGHALAQAYFDHPIDPDPMPGPPPLPTPLPPIPPMPEPFTPPFDNLGGLGGSSGCAGGGDCDGGAPILLPAYIAASCFYAVDVSDDCRQGLLPATTAVAASMLSAGAARLVAVKFPALSEVEQIKVLFTIENLAIDSVQAQLASDVQNLSAFQWGVPEAAGEAAIAAHQRYLGQIEQQARDEANSGQNWRHDWQSNTHNFQSNAYNQAVNINSFGWGGT